MGVAAVVKEFIKWKEFGQICGGGLPTCWEAPDTLVCAFTRLATEEKVKRGCCIPEQKIFDVLGPSNSEITRKLFTVMSLGR